jgi:COP9 signalosome complex subunit 7
MSKFSNLTLLYKQLFHLWLWLVDIIHGKLDQKNSQLEVDYAIGRDIQPADLGSIVSTLQDWCVSCEAVLSCVETQINRANAEKNRRLKHKEAIEQEVTAHM